MASYDSPGFHNLMPGIPDRDGSMTAPGSVLPDRPDTSGSLSDRIQQGTMGNSAVITPVGGTLANADVVQVGPKDTLLPGAGVHLRRRLGLADWRGGVVHWPDGCRAWVGHYGWASPKFDVEPGP